MNRNIVLLFLIGLLLLSACGGAEWQEYTSEEGRFAILFPGRPKLELNRIEAEPVALDVHTYTVDQGSIAYSVAYADRPATTTEPTEIQAIFDASWANVEGEVNNRTSISLDGVPGEEALIRHPTGAIVRQRVYLVGARLYLLAVTGDQESDQASAEAQRFFDSFQPYVATE